jgi:carboxymethylenebutenolidase
LVESLITEYKTVNVEDGSQMRVYYARPATASRHCSIFVFQEAFGVNQHIRDVAERFAREGYVAVAPELFHRTAAGFEGSYTDFQSTTPHIQALTDEGLAKDIRATYELVKEDSAADSERIATVGFCMGGRVSFLANSLLPLSAAVSFYGGGIAPSPRGPGLLARTADLNGPMLLFWGGLDQHIGPDQHQAISGALRAAGKRFVNVEISDAGHGFFCDARTSYNPNAARESWALTLAFLMNHLGKI